MFGQNKILKVENHDGLNLDVTEIFPTIQAEGIYTGYPAVFIRLGGCNLACKFCDTEFERYDNLALDEILKQVRQLARNDKDEVVRKLVVITGGEPLRQPIERLCDELIKSGFSVQIETNGTLFRQLPKAVKIICSPKSNNGKYHAIRADLLERITAFKFIVSANVGGYKEVNDLRQGKEIPIYVQPMDEYDEKKEYCQYSFNT